MVEMDSVGGGGNMREPEAKAEAAVKIGIVGIGAMGKGLVYQSSITPGIDFVAVADRKIERCVDCLTWLGVNYRIVSNPPEMKAAISAGIVAVCEDGRLIAECAMIDAMVDATSAIGEAGETAVVALRNGKHLVLMNSEVDLIFGPYLAKLAEECDVVYTSCDGDQYGVIKRLIDEIRYWGFDLVMAGNIKGFLDRYANPTSIIAEADKRNLDYRMCASYTDGTKLNIEMALLANAFDLSPVIPGMTGPRTSHVQDAVDLFDYDTLWNRKQPFVDYILGAEPGGGVFVVGYNGNRYQQDMMAYYKMGKGPYYIFYRPYHLCHVESMKCIEDAVRKRESLMKPTFGFRTNVYAYAKKDLRQGEILDGIGGYTCYGLIENYTDNKGIPICLAESVVLRRDINKDEKLNFSDIDYDPLRSDFELYFKAINLPSGS